MIDRHKLTAIVAFTGCTIAAITAITVISISKPADGSVVERSSYSQGWANVVTRQPRHGIYLGPDLDQPVPPLSDAAMVDSCKRYTENEGALLLDEVTDTDAYMQGCVDATALTSLEVER